MFNVNRATKPSIDHLKHDEESVYYGYRQPPKNYVQSINESSLFDKKLNFDINLQTMNRYSLKLSRTLLTLAALMLASVTQATVMFTPFGNVTSYYHPNETLPYLRQMHLINNTAYDSDVPNSKTNRTYKVSNFSNDSATLAAIDIKYPIYVSIADGRFSAQFSKLTKLMVWSSSSASNSLCRYRTVLGQGV